MLRQLAVIHSGVSYEQFFQELNKIKSSLPKEQWEDLIFESQILREAGTHDPLPSIIISKWEK